mmetsp:Transcript_598/g.1590  ORF Transcript_598/g.1590 Transcript_598/m.1590 type:complete len:237 (+) Transcript_598:336-1046(+)
MFRSGQLLSISISLGGLLRIPDATCRALAMRRLSSSSSATSPSPRGSSRDKKRSIKGSVLKYRGRSSQFLGSGADHSLTSGASRDFVVSHRAQPALARASTRKQARVNSRRGAGRNFFSQLMIGITGSISSTTGSRNSLKETATPRPAIMSSKSQSTHSLSAGMFTTTAAAVAAFIKTHAISSWEEGGSDAPPSLGGHCEQAKSIAKKLRTQIMWITLCHMGAVPETSEKARTTHN